MHLGLTSCLQDILCLVQLWLLSVCINRGYRGIACVKQSANAKLDAFYSNQVIFIMNKNIYVTVNLTNWLICIITGYFTITNIAGEFNKILTNNYFNRLFYISKFIWLK